MFYHELHDDEQALIQGGDETPFTFCLADEEAGDGTAAAARVREEVEIAAAWLAGRGVGGIRADGRRGRLWTAREESGKAFIYLLDRYPVRRENGYNLVDAGGR